MKSMTSRNSASMASSASTSGSSRRPTMSTPAALIDAHASSKAALVAASVSAQPAVSSRINRAGRRAAGNAAGPAMLGNPASLPCCDSHQAVVHMSGIVPARTPTQFMLGADGNPPIVLIAPLEGLSAYVPQ